MELNITNSEAAINKAIFGQFSESKERIEAAFGAELERQRLDTKKACRVNYRQGVDGYNEENWEAMIKWLVEYFPKLEQAFRPEIEKVKRNK